mmetsp:Transcript_99563/g.197349  ORF Transcript_99563/g.197349 Transcript_99563/m.197349 type:complete len:92 (+) Transcript_99563:37-312(+)
MGAPPSSSGGSQHIDTAAACVHEARTPVGGHGAIAAVREGLDGKENAPTPAELLDATRTVYQVFPFRPHNQAGGLSADASTASILPDALTP